MTRVHNFSAGPATLPEPVLRRAAGEMLDWHGCGMSVMEMSHRGPEFIDIHSRAEAALRELLDVPQTYRVLFMQGGAIGQNAFVPMNLLRGRKRIDFVDTGSWSQKSIKEARKYAEVSIVASGRDEEAGAYTHVPAQSQWRLDDDAAYVHICANETIDGVEYHWLPETGNVPLVADMSSSFMSRPIDIRRHGLIYAGAQKNVAMAGLTIVIVRDDLIGEALPITPSAFDYRLQADADSMFNTPATYGIYIAGLVFDWMKEQGGMAGIAQRNQAKADALYQCLDASGFYSNRIAVADRSRMNVPFHLPDARLDGPFLKGAGERGLLQLKGHRSVGGMRASLYNAMTLEGVQALVGWMREFEKAHG